MTRVRIPRTASTALRIPKSRRTPRRGGRGLGG
jgi:hypothetical protein